MIFYNPNLKEVSMRIRERQFSKCSLNKRKRERLLATFVVAPDDMSDDELSEFLSHIRKCQKCRRDALILLEVFDEIGRIVLRDIDLSSISNS